MAEKLLQRVKRDAGNNCFHAECMAHPFGLCMRTFDFGRLHDGADMTPSGVSRNGHRCTLRPGSRRFCAARMP